MTDEATAPEASWSAILTIWWSFIWRCTVWSMMAGSLLGAVAGALAAVAGRVDLARPLGMRMGYLGSIPVSMYALKVVLAKKYDGFTIALVPSKPVS